MLMPSDFNSWAALFIGIGLLAIGIGYIASPRFVEWMLNKDRRGRMWANLLGREKARIAIRYIFSVVLMLIGLVVILISIGPL